MKKLYRVHAEIELVIAATSHAEAVREAEYLIDVQDGGAEVQASAEEIHHAGGLPRDWRDLGTIPFCSEGDKTIGQYLDTPSEGESE